MTGAAQVFTDGGSTARRSAAARYCAEFLTG